MLLYYTNTMLYYTILIWYIFCVVCGVHWFNLAKNWAVLYDRLKHLEAPQFPKATFWYQKLLFEETNVISTPYIYYIYIWTKELTLVVIWIYLVY